MNKEECRQLIDEWRGENPDAAVSGVFMGKFYVGRKEDVCNELEEKLNELK